MQFRTQESGDSNTNAGYENRGFEPDAATNDAAQQRNNGVSNYQHNVEWVLSQLSYYLPVAIGRVEKQVVRKYAGLCPQFHNNINKVQITFRLFR